MNNDIFNWTIEIIDKRLTGDDECFLREYTPIIPTKPIIIDTKWFNIQNISMQKKLYEKFPDLMLENINTNYFSIFDGCNPIYDKFINIYETQYKSNNNYVIELSKSEINELIKLCDNNDIITDENIKLYVSSELYTKIEIEFEKCNKKSGLNGIYVKNNNFHFKSFSAFSIYDIIKNLINSIHILQYKIEDMYTIILQPWNNEIDNFDTYSVFIVNKTIKCISQKKIKSFNVDIIPCDIINSIIIMVNKEKISDLYNDCVIDCYINKNNEAIIIKIKCGYSWSSTKSALFTWSEIINFNKPVFRILSNRTC